MTSVTSHLINTELPGSNGAKLLECVSSLLHDSGVYRISFCGKHYVDVNNLHKMSSTLKDAYSFPALVASVGKTKKAVMQVAQAVTSCGGCCSNFTTSMHVQQVAYYALLCSKEFMNGLKQIFSVLKFLGILSIVPVLSAKVYVFRVAKSVCAIYCAVIDGGLAICHLCTLPSSDKKKQTEEGLNTFKSMCIIILSTAGISSFMHWSVLKISIPTKHLCNFSILFSSVTVNTIRATN